MDNQQATDTGHNPGASRRKRDELWAVVVAVLIIGMAGVYFWQHQKVVSLTGQVADLQASRQPGAGQTAASVSLDTNAAVKLLNDFYSAYAKSVDGTMHDKLIAQYGTSNLAFYRAYYQHGFDPILCAQALPLGVSVKNPVLKNNSVKAEIHENFSGDHVVQAVVVDRGGLKIDSVTCPAPEGNLPPVPPAEGP